MLDEFKLQYVEKCINGDGFDEELKALFNSILKIHLEENHERMDELIQEILDEHSPREPTKDELLQEENEQLRREMSALWENLSEIAKEIKS